MTTEAPPPDETPGGEGASEGETEEARGRGRPSKLEPDLVKVFCAALRRGHPPESAALVAGIGKSTYHAWRKQGEADRAAGLETKHTDFLDRSDRAIALFHDKHLRRIDKATAGEGSVEGARLSLGLLGRRAPEYFAEKKGVELSGPGGKAVQLETKHVDVRSLPLDELERLARGDAPSGGGGA